MSSILFLLFVGWFASAQAGELTVDLGKSAAANFVGALARWDADGNPRTPVNPKAKIDAPEVQAKAERREGNVWVFRSLPPGRYDLVILAGERIRVEGFHYPPVLEFDRPLPGSAPEPPQDERDRVVQDIAAARHYENKVAPLYLAGDAKQIRVLVQLVRDQPTSYDAEYGTPVATVRHEVWQYTNRYGGWAKEKKTKILDRLLLPRSEFRRWTWVWEPALGGIEVKDRPVRISCEVPDRFDPRRSRGWFAD
jgi:hypothetical protein